MSHSFYGLLFVDPVQYLLHESGCPRFCSRSSSRRCFLFQGFLTYVTCDLRFLLCIHMAGQDNKTNRLLMGMVTNVVSWGSEVTTGVRRLWLRFGGYSWGSEVTNEVRRLRLRFGGYGWGPGQILTIDKQGQIDKWEITRVDAELLHCEDTRYVPTTYWIVALWRHKIHTHNTLNYWIVKTLDTYPLLNCCIVKTLLLNLFSECS